MQIGLVTMRTDPMRGGAERYTVDLAVALAALGHDVTLLAAHLDGAPAGVRAVHLGRRRLTRTGRYTAFLRALDRHLADTHYDVVHAMLPVHECDAYHPHAGVAKAAMTDHSWRKRITNPRPFRVAGTEAELLESTRAVVLCLSDYVKRAVKQNYALSEDRLPIVFNGVDLAKFAPASAETRSSCRAALGVPPDAPAALFMGQDYQRKGLRHAIAALALASERSAPGRTAPRLLVVGRGRQGPYEQLARELGVAEQVLFLGQRPDPQSTYHAADFLVLPTRHDPCSLAVLEALACGVPVISTVFNGACEVMTNGVHGFVLKDPGDERALADAMIQLLDPATQLQMSQAAVALRPRLSFEEHLRTLLDVYGRIVAGKTKV